MVYAGKKGEQRYSLGVSGRLMDSNLVMWDAETGSLWSQILGKALHGEAKGVELDMLPAVFVSLETWARLHPKTKVLNLGTVRSRGWFYTSDDLARGSVRGRGGQQSIGIGLRRGGDTLVIDLAVLHERGAVPVEVGETPLVVVWHAGEKAALVYDRRVGGDAVDVELRGRDLVETGGEWRWSALSGAAVAGGEAPLRRFPYIPTYVRAWRSYYPKGRALVVDGR